MNVNEFFPHQVCINLERRPDRWQRISSRFAEHGIERVVRFSALDRNHLEIPATWNSFPGAYGCLRSHLAVVEDARQKGYSSVLVFEDDVVFESDFKTKFSNYIQQLPEDWDMLFFGAIHGRALSRITENIIRVKDSLSTYAYALRHTIYDEFIEINRRAPSVLDENTRSLQERFNSYCFMPHLAWVEDDYSDAREEAINLWWLKESFLMFGRETEDILRKTAAIISYRNGSDNSFRNLSFLVEYLSQKLSYITLLVLEQGPYASLNRNQLPSCCGLEFLPTNGIESDSWNSFLKHGIEAFGSNKEFLLFLDSNVFLTRDDIKGNLLKCREYDFANCFREIRDLTETETLSLLSGDLRWNYNGDCRSRRKNAICDSACIFTRNGIEALHRSSDQSEGSISASVEKHLRVYDSPNMARRLRSD